MQPLPPLVILVHGIETANPADSIGRLSPLLELAGFAVAEYRYGRQHLLGVRLSREAIGYSLLSMIRLAAQDGRQVIPIGHSRGCLAIHDAACLQYKAPREPAFTRAVYLSAALDYDCAPPPLIDRLDVHYTRSDRAVWWARWLVWHPFGDMGRRGCSARSAAVVNHDATGSVAGHSGWWTDRGLQYAAARLIPGLRSSLDHRFPDLGLRPE